jgi:hypothetical protein
MDRFHVVVFNYERICSFTSNFEKIANFNPELDKIFVVDCSNNYEAELMQIGRFADQKGWKLGDHINVTRRRNWGIDQGGRIDYFNKLHELTTTPKYILQFQEHYLDLASPWSRFPANTFNVDGRNFSHMIKGDCIPDGLTVDLNSLELIYEKHPEISTIYADRLNIGLFPFRNAEFFYIDGANFSTRGQYAIRTFSKTVLLACEAIFDGTYDWALFMEFFFGHQLTVNGGGFYDLANGCYFTGSNSLRKLERQKEICLHQTPEGAYYELYSKYYAKFERALSNRSIRVCL